MNWFQKEIYIKSKPRGFHLITHEVLDNFHEINNFKTGILHVFIKHTSASLTINENADIILFCSGWKNLFSLEDTLFAGAVINRLEKYLRNK